MHAGCKGGSPAEKRGIPKGGSQPPFDLRNDLRKKFI
jgi:hypothetical protein